jgi:hypothetical protein
MDLSIMACERPADGSIYLIPATVIGYNLQRKVWSKTDRAHIIVLLSN